MGNIFQEISKRPSYVRTEVCGWVYPKAYSAYRVGGFVKNVMILSVRTLWMTPGGPQGYISSTFSSMI